MALPILAATRLLAAGASRGAVASAVGKKIVTDKLFGGGKDKVKNDAKKQISPDKETGRGGALVKAEKKSISIQKLLDKPKIGGELIKDSSGNSQKKERSKSLYSIVGLIKSIQKDVDGISKLLDKKEKFDSKKLSNRKKDSNLEKKKNREDELEEDKKEKEQKKSGGISIKAPSFLERVINFFSNILLGGLVDFLLTN